MPKKEIRYAIEIAEDLHYDERTIDDIKKAKNSDELSDALMNGRKRQMKREYGF